jgi:hypothetical protein
LRKGQSALQNRELVIDVKDLTAMSQKGENVLLELMNEGGKFRNGVFTNTSRGNSPAERRNNKKASAS